MLIEGPMKIGVVTEGANAGTELHIDFTPEFRDLDTMAQGEHFQRYLATLRAQLDELTGGDPNRAGMLTVAQIGEQLLPHIAAGELALEETIVIEIAPEVPTVSLSDLLN